MAEHGGADGFEGFGGVEARFGIEFVSVAYKTFEQRTWHIVAGREWEVHLAYVFFGNAGSGMAFGDTCDFFGHTFATKQFSSENAMTDVGFGAMTINAVGVGQEDADVVEHGCGFNGGLIKPELSIVVDAQGEICDASAVA